MLRATGMRTPIQSAFTFGLIALAACEGAQTTPPPDEVVHVVLGHVFDARGRPAAGVTVALAPAAIEVTTDARGLFEAHDVAAGPLEVVARWPEPVRRCLTAVPGASMDVGDLYEGMSSGCDLPRLCLGDRDCDGLADALETEGWEIVLRLADRSLEARPVISNPDAADSDLDGVDDAREYAARLDPRRRDSDGDLLSDYAELAIFHSSGTSIDTDGDACPLATSTADAPCVTDPSLWDGYEVEMSGTSPTLADTDGDGLSDYAEIKVGGTNPRVADLPQLDLELYGNPLIEVDVDYQTGTSRHQQELARNEEEQIDTDSVSTKMSIENTVQLHTEAEIGTSTWPPSFSAKLTTDTKFQHGYFHDTSSSWKNTSVQESQQSYESWEKELVSFDDGKLSVAMKVVNRSDLSFAVDDLRVVAYRLDGGGAFTLIGTLQPDAAWGDGNQILGPGAEVTMNATLEHIGGAMMRALVRNPTAMMFEVGAYSLYQLDEQGLERTVNFAKLGEAVVQRTGLLVVDFGDGRVQRHLIATNVFRKPDGSGWGVPLAEALRDLGLDYELSVATSSLGVPGPRVLSRLEDVSAYDTCRVPDRAKVDCTKVQPRGFWVLGGTGDAFRDPPVDLEQLVLGRGERIHLVYNDDRDGDGLFDREEYLLGSSRTQPDTDGDELSDYDESKLGWAVTVEGREPYTVYSDPRFADIDGDFLSDFTESSLHTDPYLEDTDGDGDSDTIDADPLAPPCLDGDAIGLTAWWDGSYQVGLDGYTAQDVWRGEADETSSNGRLISSNPASMVNEIAGDRVFQMNPGVTDRDELIQIPSDTSINPQHELTVSAWIYWQGIGAGSSWATILAKGPEDLETFKLSISATGRLRMSLRRSTHETCWYCSFGAASLCADWSCADSDYDENLALDTTAPIPAQEWVHVTGSFGGEMLRIYVDGVLAASLSTTSTWWSGWYLNRTTTTRLDTNDRPLRIGLEDAATPDAPFRGLVDDVQLSLRSLRADQVLLIHQLGVCEPQD